MESIWLALEASPLATALKASFVAYPLVNALHILSLGAVVTSVLLLDLRTLGLWTGVAPAPFVALMRRTALLAFAAAALSGAALFSVRASEYAANPAFLAKMGLLALAGLNFVFLAKGGLAKGGLAQGRHATAASGATTLAAVLSLVLWPAILVAGRFIGFLG